MKKKIITGIIATILALGLSLNSDPLLPLITAVYCKLLPDDCPATE